MSGATHVTTDAWPCKNSAHNVGRVIAALCVKVGEKPIVNTADIGGEFQHCVLNEVDEKFVDNIGLLIPALCTQFDTLVYLG